MKEGLSITEILQQNIDGLNTIFGLVVLMAGAVLILISGLFIKHKKVIPGLYGILLLLVFFLQQPGIGALFGGDLLVTSLGFGSWNVILLASTGLLIYPKTWQWSVEYAFLVLSVIIGSLFITMTANLLLIYLGIELISVASYILTAMPLKKRSFEAAIKYILSGAISSALMIYGISLLYGQYGTLIPNSLEINDYYDLTGWVLLLCGVFFKTSIFPFQLWVANTYEQASTEIVAFLSIVPKIGAFALMGNLVANVNHGILMNVLFLLGTITVIVGTFSAVHQSNVKRLISYGAIAHSGFILPLVVMPTGFVGDTFIFYVSVYALINLAAFYFIARHEEEFGLEVSDWNGLGKGNRIMGVSLICIMIALIGLPPTAGFSIKLFMFSAVLSYFQETDNVFVLSYFLIGILSTAISLFFYLKIPYHYFFKERRSNTASKTNGELILLFFSLLLLWIFIQPDIFHNIVLTISKP